MSDAPAPEPRPDHPLLPGASPATIRSYLFSEDQLTFDAAYAAALDDARTTLDLTAVHQLVEDWRCVAAVQYDPARFRRTVRRAAKVMTGTEPPEDEPLSVTRARVGL